MCYLLQSATLWVDDKQVTRVCMCVSGNLLPSQVLVSSYTNFSPSFKFSYNNLYNLPIIIFHVHFRFQHSLE